MIHASLTKNPASVAAWWFARRSSDVCTAKDQAAFEAWLEKNSVNADRYRLVEDTWAAVGEAASAPGVRRLRRQALAAGPHRRRVGFLPLVGMATASICLIAGTALLFRRPLAALIAPTWSQAYRTTQGQQAVMILPDGSRAALNTSTELQVRYTAFRRELHLVRGEAWFDVAKNPARPFVVHAASHDVTAVGTSFDVRLEERGLRVAVAVGKVAVNGAAGPLLSRVIAGQRMDVIDGVAVLREAQGPVAGDWRDGHVEFNAITLNEAVAEMNRYLGKPIVLDDRTIGLLRISGVFKAGKGTSFLATLPLSYPLAVHESTEATHVDWSNQQKNSRR